MNLNFDSLLSRLFCLTLGHQYWRFDEDEMQVELDYPRDMSMWSGIGYNIDSAFQYKDGLH